MNEVRASVRFLVLVPLLAALAAGAGEGALRREGRASVDPSAADGALAEGPAGAPVRRLVERFDIEPYSDFSSK